MLHELLLALVGLPGDVITAKTENGRETALHVAEDASFVDPSERQLLDRLARLGHHYRRLERFVAERGGGAVAELYARALCGGLEEVMDGYRARVLAAEHDALAAAPAPFPLPQLLHGLALYVQVFPALHALVDDVEGAGGGALRGGELLQLLRGRSLSGVPAVQQCFERLLFHTHRVLFNQIGSWVVSGMLTDPHGEFFIRKPRLADASAAADATDAASAALPRGRWNEQYELNLAMLPTSHVPVAVARQVLFIGRAVNLLQHPEVARLGQQLLPHADALAFAQAVHTLRQQPAFDLISMRLALSEMRAVVTRHLWQLVVNYFLVGRGEFWQAFLDAMDARGIFDAPPTARAERDVNDGPWQSAAAACGEGGGDRRHGGGGGGGGRGAAGRGHPAGAGGGGGGDDNDDEGDDDDHFARLSVRLDQSSFSCDTFTRRGVRTHASASGSCTVVAGGADLDERRGGVTVTGPGPRDVGGVWHSSRKILDQGFFTRFRVALPEAVRGHGDASSASAPAAAAAGAATRRASDPPPLPWVASGHGFSFVVQNSGMSAVPEVSLHPVVAAGREANTVLDRAGQPVVARYESVPNSVEVYFHVPGGGGGGDDDAYVGVFARAAGADPSAAPEVAAFAPASRAPSLRRLGDGGEHDVEVEYEAPKAGGKGVLRVRVDGSTALEAPFALGTHVRLDSGRGWVGFTAATGFDAGAGARAGRRRQLRRVLSRWSFREAGAMSAGAWRQLGLEYRVQAPLDLVLLPDDFDRYNALFRFLFLVKRVQSSLQRVWPWQGRSRKLPAAQGAALLPVFALRANMQFLVDSLQYYLHVDVVEAQFARLEAAVRDSKDFETVRQSHEEYLSALSRYCFLHARVMSRALHRIFDLCFEFCALVQGLDGDAAPDARQVARLSRDFHLQASFLFTVLSRKAQQYSSPHLARLVLRMDFNRFWSSQASELGVDRGVGGL